MVINLRTIITWRISYRNIRQSTGFTGSNIGVGHPNKGVIIGYLAIAPLGLAVISGFASDNLGNDESHLS
jgi:hypothetical protein